MFNVVSNNSYIKNAKEVVITFNSNPRASQIHIYRANEGNAWGMSTYSTSTPYVLTVKACCMFDQGTIQIGCSINTWGLSAIPISVAANSIKYR